MFGLAKRIITQTQMRTVKARRSDFIHGVKEKLAPGAHIRKKETKEFWSQLRQDSMASNGRRVGLTKKDVQTSLAKILIKARKGEGHINKREVKDLIRATGVSEKKVFSYAAEMSHEKNNQHQNEIRVSENKSKEIEIHNHISDIISKGLDNAKVGVTPFSSSLNHGGNNILTKFSVSENNIRKVEDNILYRNMNQHIENNQHNDVGEKTNEKEDIKARLARIQGKADSYDTDAEK